MSPGQNRTSRKFELTSPHAERAEWASVCGEGVIISYNFKVKQQDRWPDTSIKPDTTNTFLLTQIFQTSQAGTQYFSMAQKAPALSHTHALSNFRCDGCEWLL